MTLLLFSSLASGQEFYGIDIHGFASQGYLRTTDNNYLGKSSKGSFEFNEVGINFQKDLTDNLRVGLQLFARDLGSQGNNEVKIDWALLDYKWKPFLNFRAGKIKMPYGFYNQGRDVDMLRTSIILPQSIYNEPIRDVIASLEGFSFYGNFDFNNGGSLEYELIAGTISIDSDFPFIKDPYLEIVNGAASGAAAGLANVPGFSGVETLTGGLRFDMKYMYVFSLIYNTPIEGFRLGGTILELEGDWEGDFSLITNFANPADPTGTLLISSVSKVSFTTEVLIRSGIVSLEYVWKNLTLSAEGVVMQFYLDNEKSDGRNGGLYIGGSYEFNDKFTLGLYYSVNYDNLKDKDGSDLPAIGKKDFQAWQNDFVISGRYDVNEYLVLKAEIHIINGAADLNSVDNQRDPIKEDWLLFALKATVSF